MKDTATSPLPQPEVTVCSRAPRTGPRGIDRYTFLDGGRRYFFAFADLIAFLTPAFFADAFLGRRRARAAPAMATNLDSAM